MSAAELEQLAGQVRSLAGNSTADLVGIAPGTEFSADELGELEQLDDFDPLAESDSF